MKILTLIALDSKKIKSLNSNIVVQTKSYNHVSKEDVTDADIIVGNIHPSLLPYAKQLKWLQLYSAGNDAYSYDDLPKGCILSNASGTFGVTIAEHLVMVTLMLMREMPTYFKQQQQHVWKDLRSISMIYKSTIMIVGCGDIGQRYAKNLKALGAHTIGVKAHRVEQLDGFDEVYILDEMDDHLGRCDVVCLCLPKVKTSDNLFDAKRFGLLKQGSYFLNVGRGNAVVEEALYEALNNKSLNGAHLDVFQEEPLDSNSKLWDAKNLIVTPHMSGTFANHHTKELFQDLFMKNLASFLTSKSMFKTVDKKTGY